MFVKGCRKNYDIIDVGHLIQDEEKPYKYTYLCSSDSCNQDLEEILEDVRKCFLALPYKEITVELIRYISITW